MPEKRMSWDPLQYARYADERGRPFLDLLGRVECDDPRHVVDLGCGPGNLTALLALRWPQARVEGIDSSPEMIAAAAPHASAALTFTVGDAATWPVPDDLDVLISNATLQWIPDHLDLLGRWARALRPGSWIAVQLPGNFRAPSHTLMRAMAESDRWRPALDDVLRHHDAVAAPEKYAQLLMSAGLVADVWETTYLHVLPGAAPVLEWLRGTGLRPILAALSEEDGAEFEAELAGRLREAYPPTEHGTVLPFRRIFAVGHRPE
jgi:trans-aconitate 2-methyltransferase